MSGLNTAQVIPLPPPYLGQYDRVPVVSIENPYCEELTNFNCYDGKLSLRHGDAFYCDPLGIGSEHRTIGLVTYKNSIQIAVTVGPLDDEIYTITWWNVSTATPVVIGTHSGPDGVIASPMSTIEFGGCIYFLGVWLTGPSLYRYDGTALSGTSFTFTGAFPIVGCGHRNRVYFGTFASPTFLYGAVDAIAGPMTSVNMNTVTTRGGNILIIRSFSVSDTTTAQNLLGVVFSTGEVLVYDGAYPASSDWRIVGRFFIPPPVAYNAVIDFDGDSLIITKVGIISLRDLFTKGSKAARRDSLSSPISNRWRQIIKSVSGSFATVINPGVYDAINDRIIVLFPVYVSKTGDVSNHPFFLIYDIARGAWIEHRGGLNFGGSRVNSFRDEIYYSIGGNTSTALFKKESRADFKDALIGAFGTASYPFRILSAPMPLAKTTVNRLVGIELLTKGDWPTITDIKMISDLGRSVSGNTRLPAFASGDVMAKPFVSNGVEGTYIQYDISCSGSGSPASYGCEIYGVNAVFEQGGLR